MLRLRDKVKEMDIGLIRVDGTVTHDLIEEAGLSSELGHTEALRWVYSYRVPFPDVRYYSYEELIV
jgi:hypothetical protein